MPFLNPISIISILIALSIHEWAHAIVATKLGDPTPGEHGRLTVNPIAHLDPLGALLFLAVGFGWAKPVPVNPLYFRHPRRDTCLVAAAGPASNLVLAFIALAGLAMLGQGAELSAMGLLETPARGQVLTAFVLQLLASSLFINLGLMAFNLLPIAPLDGSKVLQAFIPRRFADRYEEFMRVGMYILLAIFVAEGIFHIPILSIWIVTIMDAVLAGMQSVVGLFVQ